MLLWIGLIATLLTTRQQNIYWNKILILRQGYGDGFGKWDTTSEWPRLTRTLEARRRLERWTDWKANSAKRPKNWETGQSKRQGAKWILHTFLWVKNYYPEGFPGGTNGKESACQCRRHKRHGLNPWVGKIPCSRKWCSTPLFLPRKFHGQRNLMGYSPWGRRVGLNWVTEHRPRHPITKEANYLWEIGWLPPYISGTDIPPSPRAATTFLNRKSGHSSQLCCSKTKPFFEKKAISKNIYM